ncbi:uncharacterized protein LOC109864053 isoform X2 [Pseudomyrmex gracilis]|uniref:uncharacterized protein LOC109864053 isoform X2 n=1 Tax=Pseudomyrmex gracilis TaxID=219809 RepID=UPI000994F277|nr:uncharacterized protein LOC109864053 isoform X2 [Pseudomyrmex gracilis]
MNRINGDALKMGDKSPSPDCGEEQKLISPTTPTTPMIVQVTKNPYASLKYRSRYRAGPTRKLRRRAVLKNGDCNVLQSRISRRSLRFLQDLFTTLVDTQWRWTLLCFILSFLLSWLGFAVLWWLIAFTHGDFEEDHLPPFQVENNWTPCVYNIFSFTSCFLFSIETQHTIGYGSRSTTEECPEAIFVMCIQSISGCMIQAFMVGIVFAKMTRPKQRTQTLLFSRNAVICQRDGELCLMFRVGDMRKSHIIGANVRAQVIRTKTTKEGEILSQHQQELTVGTDGENGNLFFIWPTTIIHRINESSPFYTMSAEDMLTERFEVVLILEGTIESTGQTTQARSSYLPQEILWGHRFDPMVSYSKERQGYEVDYSLFNSTTQVDTPLCSGKELAEFYRDEIRQGTGVLIDEDHLTGRQCWCNCHASINQRCLRTPLSPLTCSNCTCSNCTSHEFPSENMEQSRVFNFDPDAIQVMQDTEFEQLPEAVNREIVKNSEEIVFEDEEEISPTDFNRNPNYDVFVINNRSFRGSGRNTTNRAIAPTREQKHSMRDSFANEKQQKSLKQSSRNNSFIIDDKKSFRESRKKAVDNVRNIRILESQKSFRETRKYLAVPLDHANGRPFFHQRLNYDLLRQGKNDHLMRQYDNIRIENEKTLKRPSSDSLAKIVVQRKLCSNDLRLPISPVSDLSPESGFCDGSPQSNHTEPRLFTRRMKYIDEVLDREKSSSSESNLSQKNVASDVDNLKECAKDYTFEISNCKRNDVKDDENTIVLHSSPSCKNISDDNDIPIKKEENIDDSKLSIIEEQSTRGKDNIQNVDETRKADSSLNIDTSYKCVIENDDLEEFDNTIDIEEPLINNNRIIITKMQNSEFSEHDISSENLVTKLI